MIERVLVVRIFILDHRENLLPSNQRAKRITSTKPA
jgi:hypothetical protein